jgi:hypothetical protein
MAPLAELVARRLQQQHSMLVIQQMLLAELVAMVVMAVV